MQTHTFYKMSPMQANLGYKPVKYDSRKRRCNKLKDTLKKKKKKFKTQWRVIYVVKSARGFQ